MTSAINRSLHYDMCSLHSIPINYCLIIMPNHSIIIHVSIQGSIGKHFLHSDPSIICNQLYQYSNYFACSHITIQTSFVP